MDSTDKENLVEVEKHMHNLHQSRNLPLQATKINILEDEKRDTKRSWPQIQVLEKQLRSKETRISCLEGVIRDNEILLKKQKHDLRERQRIISSKESEDRRKSAKLRQYEISAQRDENREKRSKMERKDLEIEYERLEDLFEIEINALEEEKSGLLRQLEKAQQEITCQESELATFRKQTHGLQQLQSTVTFIDREISSCESSELKVKSNANDETEAVKSRDKVDAEIDPQVSVTGDSNSDIKKLLQQCSDLETQTFLLKQQVRSSEAKVASAEYKLASAEVALMESQAFNDELLNYQQSSGSPSVPIYIANLKEQIDQLRAELNTSRSSLIEARVEAQVNATDEIMLHDSSKDGTEMLTAQVQELKAQVDKVRQELSTTVIALEAAQVKVASLERTNERLLHEKENLSTLASQVLCLREEIAKIEQQHESTLEELSGEQTKNAELFSVNSKLNDILSKTSIAAEELKAEILQLQQNQTNLDHSICIAVSPVSPRSAAESVVNELQEEEGLRIAHAAIGNLKREILELQKTVEQRDIELRRQGKDLSAEQRQVSRCLKKIETYKEAMDNMTIKQGMREVEVAQQLKAQQQECESQRQRYEVTETRNRRRYLMTVRDKSL